MAFGFEDPVSPAKAVTKFIKETKKGEILGAVLDGKLLSVEETKALAALPSKDELYAKMLGSIIHRHQVSQILSMLFFLNLQEQWQQSEIKKLHNIFAANLFRQLCLDIVLVNF